MHLRLVLENLLAPLTQRWTMWSAAVGGHTVTDARAPGYRVHYFNPQGLWNKGRLTQVVEVEGARLIYLSGQTPADAEYRVKSGDFRAQVNQVYDNIEIALRAAGARMNHVVKTTTYLTDAAYIAPLREARAARYASLKAPPANTLLVVSALAEPEFLVEIEVIAAVPAG
ncbi:MAG: RidA family protein [Betaproteobacteria bacterium]|nr:RidA family protein [Betaproteobacteria bacterium]